MNSGEPKTKEDLRDHDITMAEREIWSGITKLMVLGKVNILREIHSELGEKLRPKQLETAREN
jgi:hypothetical protein